jgi:hypothetical protein
MVTVYFSRKGDQLFSADNILNQIMPDWRCYRYGGKVSVKGIPDLIRPKYTDQGMRYMLDACMFIKPKHSIETYEFGWNGFEQAHDDLNNAYTDQSVNIYQWRQERPELSYLFNLLKNKPECKQFMDKILVLGAHVPATDIHSAYDKMIQLWRQRMSAAFGNRVWTYNLGLRIHHEICMALELPRSTTSGKWNLMIHLIGDDLKLKHQDLLSSIEDHLSLDVQELRTARHRAIQQGVNAWFDSNMINRILTKCETLHGESAMTMYKKLYKHHVTQVMLHAMEQSIYQTIKEYEKQ